MAITLVQAAPQAGGQPPTGPTFTDACASNYLIVCAGAITGGSYADITGVTALDSVNGAYTLAATYLDVTNQNGYGWWYKVCTGSGIPVITFSTGDYLVANAAMWNGFVGTPTLVTGDTYDMAAQSTATPAWNIPTTQANELSLVQFEAGANYFSVGPANYTAMNGSGLPMGYYAVIASAGSTVFGGTLGNGAGGSSGLAVGFYDKLAASGLFVPNYLSPGAESIFLCP